VSELTCATRHGRYDQGRIKEPVRIIPLASGRNSGGGEEIGIRVATIPRRLFIPISKQKQFWSTQTTVRPRLHSGHAALGLRISDTTTLAVSSLTGNKIRLYQAKEPSIRRILSSPARTVGAGNSGSLTRSGIRYTVRLNQKRANIFTPMGSS